MLNSRSFAHINQVQPVQITEYRASDTFYIGFLEHPVPQEYVLNFDVAGVGYRPGLLWGEETTGYVRPISHFACGLAIQPQFSFANCYCSELRAVSDGYGKLELAGQEVHQFRARQGQLPVTEFYVPGQAGQLKQATSKF